MAIRIKYRGREIECDTQEEFESINRALEEEERRVRSEGIRRLGEKLLGAGTHWTPISFSKFVESLGEAQKKILGVLVTKGRMTDAEMRKILKVDTNQQLAGILSGISKQAAGLNIPARKVYTIEKEFASGDIMRAYAISIEFLQMAQEMNWPDS